MNYQGKHLIRPPSEADSIILQVTVGCPHNKCTFCGTYKEERFCLKDEAIIEADLDFAARYCQGQKRLFLADGDVLALSHKRLVRLFSRIRRKLPWVNRLSLYGSTGAIRAKAVEQLVELKKLGLNRIYMGMESGYDPVLAAIRKGANGAAMIEAARRVRDAGLFLSVTVLLGIGGTALSEEHARATGRVLSAMNPNQVAILTLMLLENTPLHQEARSGKFTLPDRRGLLRELRIMVENLTVEKSQIQANHASNYLSINGRLPRDKEKVLGRIDQALAGKRRLKPERLRAL